jgi:hypothetical protein
MRVSDVRLRHLIIPGSPDRDEYGILHKASKKDFAMTRLNTIHRCKALPKRISCGDGVAESARFC